MKKLLSLLFLTASVLIGTAANITLSWDSGNPPNTVDGYVVYRLTGTNWLAVGRTTNTSYTLSGITPGAYTFSVTATNEWGESPRSASVSSPVVCGSPTNMIIIVIQ